MPSTQIRERLEGNPAAADHPHRQRLDQGQPDAVSRHHRPAGDEGDLTSMPPTRARRSAPSRSPRRPGGDAQQWREQLFDVLTRARRQGPASPAPISKARTFRVETIREVIREQTLARLIQPVLCGSGREHIGIQPLMDAVLLLPAQPARSAAGRRAQSEEEGQGRETQARPEGAVLRPGLQDRRRQARRSVSTCASTPAR